MTTPEPPRAEAAPGADPTELRDRLIGLLRSGDRAAAAQALELLGALDDLRVVRALAEGSSLDDQGRIAAGGVLSGVPETLRRQLALQLMRRLGWLENAVFLNLEAHGEMTDLSPIAGLTGLRQLCLPSGETFCDLSGLDTLTGLRRLSAYGLRGVDDFRLIGSARSLQVLALEDCEIEGIPDFLGQLTDLRELTLGDCWIHDLRALPHMPRLERLYLPFCYPFSSVAGVERAPMLSLLHVQRSAKAIDLSALAQHHRLRTLSLHECAALEDLAPLSGLTRLQVLRLTRNTALSDLSPLSGLSGLRTLEISMSDSLVDCAPIAGLRGLSSLALRDCKAIVDFSVLSSLSGLRSLELSLLPALADLAPLGSLRKLRVLEISACPQVTDLSALAGCVSLRKLSVSGEEVDLSTLPPLSGLEELHLYLTPVWDLSLLLRHPRLKRVGLRHPSLVGADLSVLDSRPDLEICGQEALVEAWAARHA